ncbi:MAG: PDC sensor domain-containing protein [Campylobacteraceae bacterium]|nr:PDC sensor domain-containing protein [Campylobacteraceae bacterium]
MIIREVQQFAESRTRARAYLCYLFNRNMPSGLPNPSTQEIKKSLDKIVNEVEDFEALYILDDKGVQVTNNITNKKSHKGGKDQNRGNKSYFYRTVKEKRCILTDPYPSILTNELTVTAAYPLYDDKGELRYVVCIDISLKDVIKIAQPSSMQSIFSNFTKITYGMFSFALFIIAFLLFFNSVTNLMMHSFFSAIQDIDMMFKSTILLTLSLAIFDLVKTIFEEEVLGKNKKDEAHDIHKTMVRFLGSIVIALAIEALMLVFKFAITDPKNMLSAIYLILGVSTLLVSLAIYVKMVSIKK